MEKPKSLDSLFEKKIFRIPDYQRGYAWQKNHLEEFWEDLINLSYGRSHYTGVLTLKERSSQEVIKTDNEFWLVDDHSYKIYDIVDGQQRLTTFVIFLQAFIDFMKNLDGNAGKSNKEIYITDSFRLEDVVSTYLFETKPGSAQDPTYKFGYQKDNPSYDYLRYKIFKESGAPQLEETFYTLNLCNAKQYFMGELEKHHAKEGTQGLQDIYKKLTKNFMFNEYIIKDKFDVFVTFETMNNRGKRLSNLELLKNRLIYLTTLYSDDELEPDKRKQLRTAINDAWKEVYRQLGRNHKRPLNDDDFLKAHWIMYFKYSRKESNDYIKFLLGEQFSLHKVYKKTAGDVEVTQPMEQGPDRDMDETGFDNGYTNEPELERKARLEPDDIRRYVDSLKESAVHWFNSHFPQFASDLSQEEKNALDKLNRVGMGYFRPLVMSVSKNENDPLERTRFLKDVERFIFIVFRLSQSRRNYSSSEFYNAARAFNEKRLTLSQLKEMLDKQAEFCFNADGSLDPAYFYHELSKRFKNVGKEGYYRWNGLHYFLFEYELHLCRQSRQEKLSWEDFMKPSKDKVSIEHIFPQTPTKCWEEAFSNVDQDQYYRYQGSIGNLLLLSMSVNISLQNDDFESKKRPKEDQNGQKVRNGYSDGSHSEIKVSTSEKWGPEEIENRGKALLSFMEERWGFKFKDDDTKSKLLFLEDDAAS